MKMVEYQRVIAEINLDNIANNVKVVKERLNENTKLLAVVKADAYGHGAVEVSKVALYNGADWLGVAICDEGVQLRKNNIFVPILLLGYTPDAKIDEVIINELTQTVFSLDMAKKLSDAAIKLNKTANIHIKIDTGMGRIGFLPNEKTIKTIAEISKLPNLKITGMYTHFATADEADKTFTYKQYEKFRFVSDSVDKIIGRNYLRHSANSGTILDMPELSMDMVREGIILYGLFPSDNVKKDIDIKPAMSLKTHISFIKMLPEGYSVGYGRTFRTKRQTQVATVPVGYADGYSRLFGNKTNVLIGGKRAKVIGNICMDQFMTDITDITDTVGIDNIKAGDEVVLMGRQGDEFISAEELAEIQGTINYEIICSIGKRVPRVYVKNNSILKTVSSL